MIGIIFAQFLHGCYQNINHRIEMTTYLALLTRNENKSIAGWMQAHFYVERESNIRIEMFERKINKVIKSVDEYPYIAGENRGDINPNENKSKN